MELIVRQNKARKKKGAARGSANCNYGQDYLSSSQPIIPHPTQTFGNEFMEESPYGCPSTYKPSKRLYGGGENKQGSEETYAGAVAYENDGSDIENDF
jgi:hypothetical protein